MPAVFPVSARLRLRRSDGAIYLDRWGLEDNRIGGIFLHKMSAPDPGIDLHSHPWWFCSLILWGGYTEERCVETRACRIAKFAERHGLEQRGGRRPRRWLSIQATPLGRVHRIVELRRRKSWSLVIHGPKRREWGFYLPTGFVDWRTYDTTRRDMWAEISPDAEDRRQARERVSP